MSFDNVVSLLNKPRRYKSSKGDIVNAVRSVCPSCGGSSTKLNVSETKEGNVLVHCFGNCSTVDILNAINCDISELFAKGFKHSQPSKQLDIIKGWDWWSFAGAIEYLSEMLSISFLKLDSCSTNHEEAKEVIFSIYLEMKALEQQLKFGKKVMNHGK